MATPISVHRLAATFPPKNFSIRPESMDWLKGKMTGNPRKPPYFMGKYLMVSGEDFPVYAKIHWFFRVGSPEKSGDDARGSRLEPNARALLGPCRGWKNCSCNRRRSGIWLTPTAPPWGSWGSLLMFPPFLWRSKRLLSLIGTYWKIIRTWRS